MITHAPMSLGKNSSFMQRYCTMTSSIPGATRERICIKQFLDDWFLTANYTSACRSIHKKQRFSRFVQKNQSEQIPGDGTF